MSPVNALTVSCPILPGTTFEACLSVPLRPSPAQVTELFLLASTRGFVHIPPAFTEPCLTLPESTLKHVPLCLFAPLRPPLLR